MFMLKRTLIVWVKSPHSTCKSKFYRLTLPRVFTSTLNQSGWWSGGDGSRADSWLLATPAHQDRERIWGRERKGCKKWYWWMQMCVLNLYCHARLRMRADLRRRDGSLMLCDGHHHHDCVTRAWFLSILSRNRQSELFLFLIRRLFF